MGRIPPAPHRLGSGPASARAMVLAAALAAAVLLGAGCGDGDKGDDPVGSLYHLDPPELGLTEVAPAGPGVPVLCYHYFRAGFDPGYLARVVGSVLFGLPALGPREFWTTPIGEFEKHLRHFHDTGTRVMTLDEVADLVDAGRPLPRRAVVLTIDDADRSVYELAWPLLREYGMRAHLFVPTGHVGAAWSDLQVCTREQLREMEESGVIVLGSHTRDLHYKVKTPEGPEPVFWNPEMIGDAARADALADLAASRRRAPGGGALPAAATDVLAGPWAPVAADLLASRADLAAVAGRPPRWLAWPYGFGHGALDSVALLLDFRGTVSLEPRAFGAADTTGAVGRYTLTAKTTLAMIDGILADAGRLSPAP